MLLKFIDKGGENMNEKTKEYLKTILLDRIYSNYELCNECPEIEVFDYVSVEHLLIREIASELDIDL